MTQQGQDTLVSGTERNITQPKLYIQFGIDAYSLPESDHFLCLYIFTAELHTTLSWFIVELKCRRGRAIDTPALHPGCNVLRSRLRDQISELRFS